METLCCIIVFTYFGALTRMLLTDLSKISNAQLLPDLISSFFFANIFGSFVMGLFVPLEKLFAPNYKAWYAGVTTGFCGSCTTFSTWQRVTANKLANGQFSDGIVTLFNTIATSYVSYICGRHIGEAIFHRPVRCCRYTDVSVTITNTNMSTTPFEQRGSSKRYVYLFIVTCFVTATIWIAAFLDTSSSARQRYWVAVALGPVGSLARHFILLHNRKRPTFPLFTFMVNVSASVFSTVIFAIYIRFSSEDQNGKWMAYDLWFNYGVGVGIMGCFSTVSTFVNELRKLADTNLAHAYRYGLLSVVASQSLCILIICATFL